MTTKLKQVLSAASGVLIILAVVALPWVTHHIAYGRYPEQLFPFLPFTNGLVEAMSGTVILFELFCGCIALIALGIHLTEIGMNRYIRRPTHTHPRT